MRAARAVLLAAAVAAGSTPASAQEARRVAVVPVRDLTFAEALDHPVVGSVARAGGIGLLAGRAAVPDGIQTVSLEEVAGAPTDSPAGENILVMVVGTSESDREPDWLALAEGLPVVATAGPAGGLTSDTTGAEGIVAGADVGPTVRTFLGRPVSEDAPGSPIRVEGTAPIELYERAVDYRRIAVPIGLVVLALGIGSLVVGLVLLLLRVASPVARGTVAILGLLSVALLVALVPASVLPSLEPVVVIPGVVLFGVLLLVAALVASRGDRTRAVVVVAAVGLVLLVVDGILGWPTEVTPLLGGGALLGVRFTGLGNSAAGIVLAGTVLWATRLDPRAGAGLIAGSALFAGLPFLGADLGGGVTLFAVSGLWYGWRARGRLDAATVAITVGAAVLGGLLLVAAHALWPVTAHVTRAVEGGDLVGTFLDRLASNLRETTEIWPLWLTVIGLPVWLLAAWRGLGPFQEVTRREWWRAGVIVLAIGGMIGFVLNDTFGMAAVAFVFCSAAMVYPGLRERWTGR